MKSVGVLAIQGAFKEHIFALQRVITKDKDTYNELQVIEVSTVEHLDKCDALVIPGGESSAISITAERIGLWEPLIKYVNAGHPVWGTCAGLIILSSKIINGIPDQKCLGGLDLEVKRNAFGRQLDSFHQNLDFSSFIPTCTNFPAVFIRAPVVSAINIGESESGVEHTNDTNRNESCTTIYAANYQNKPKSLSQHRVELLSALNEDRKNLIVAVRQGNKLGTSFHPELSGDYRFHAWFLKEFVLPEIT